MAFDPSAWMLSAIDGAFMALYAQTRRNARRVAKLVIAFLPLMMLLVGSCKEAASMSDLFGLDQIRAALFPDRVIARDAEYHPAAGFVSRAQDYVQADPSALMQLTEQEIGYMFGKPALERRDADARVWQYQSAACVVDFYFYDDPAHHNESRVAHVDFRPRGDLLPGSAPRLDPVPARSQTRCLRKIAG